MPRSAPSRRPAALAGLSALLTTLVALLVPAAPAQAAGPSYVALGDSYSSGLGTRSYTNSTCKRSDLAYPRLIANQRGYALNFQACSGATVSTVTNSQLAAHNSTTASETLSVGEHGKATRREQGEQ